MKNFVAKIKENKTLSVLLLTLVLVLTACSDDRGGVAVDASGEQGGGTQPGGGGLGFAILFLVVATTVLGLFAMDRIKRNRDAKNPDSENND